LPFFALSCRRSKERSKVRVPALGEQVAQLPWLSPGAASLVALARGPAHKAWESLRTDPGAVLLLLSQAPAARAGPSVSCFTQLAGEPGICDAAASLLDGKTFAFVDWDAAPVRPVYRAAVHFAYAAAEIAERSGRGDPDNAWVAGLIAPLGWLAICAVDPAAARTCLTQSENDPNPPLLQERLWGLGQAALTRRLARRWRLPAWLAAVIGHLDLAPESARMLGADIDLVRIVQTAVILTQRQVQTLHLTVGANTGENAEALGLANSELDAIERALPGAVEWLNLPAAWEDPQSVPLLRDLVKLAADKRRLSDSPDMRQMEYEVDRLHEELRLQQASEETRLRERKLSALAELAAGAGHEINNPLAVISGQAQYLFNHEEEPSKQRALQTVISQAQRIHVILHDMMQFARPPRPQKQLVELAELTRQALDGLLELAQQRQVQLNVHLPQEAVYSCVDPRQIRTALACLVRNAVESAPAQGWARIRLELPADDRLEWTIEDNGAGLGPAKPEHLFDPFYSGKQAGRGRGLGLATAWRLTHEHGGTVRYDGQGHGPTRFILTLPRETTLTGQLGAPLTNADSALSLERQELGQIRNGAAEHPIDPVANSGGTAAKTDQTGANREALP
jgi:signal transduction histidine kinase